MTLVYKKKKKKKEKYIFKVVRLEHITTLSISNNFRAFKTTLPAQSLSQTCVFCIISGQSFTLRRVHIPVSPLRVYVVVCRASKIPSAIYNSNCPLPSLTFHSILSSLRKSGREVTCYHILYLP